MRTGSSAGQEARAGGVALLLVGVGLLAPGLVLRAGEADLRDLPRLRVVEAEVVDVDRRRRAPDLLDVVYPVDGQGLQRARVPYSAQFPPQGPRVTTGSRIAVAYAPGNPGRVRPVEGWSPGHDLLLTLGVVLSPLGTLLLLLGLLSRRRRGRYEQDGTLPAAVHDPGLGRRVVRSSRMVPVQLALPLLVLPGLLLAVLLSPAPVGAGTVLGLVGTLLLTVVLPGLAAWAHGRDGVWATPTHLVARRRHRVRRWAWDEVLELGIVVQRRPSVPAARLARPGLDLGPEDWVTLARPLLGPISAHLFARRVRELADERGIPVAESLGAHHLADRRVARLRRPPRTA